MISLLLFFILFQQYIFYISQQFLRIYYIMYSLFNTPNNLSPHINE